MGLILTTAEDGSMESSEKSSILGVSCVSGVGVFSLLGRAGNSSMMSP